MNHIYRIVWNACRNAWVAVSECCAGHARSSSKTRRARLATAAFASGLSLIWMGGAHADGSVVTANGATGSYVAANGVTVVDIARANAAGLSHNQFLKYNVDLKGLVLNNGNDAVAGRQSQLAGWVASNKNLANQAAVILNEVVSNNRSTLAGFTEVLGGKANVVLANPYGITCSGCGFINTDRVTLTTGTPNIAADGSLASFQVRQGDILINGQGLNANNQLMLDLVTRNLKVESTVNSRDLLVATGSITWDYNARNVTGTLAPSGAPSSSYAIDTAVLGGMYASTIKLIATEAGVGVRMLGDAAASTSDFTVTAAGTVELRNTVSAQRDIQIATTDTTSAALLADGASINAGRNLALSAGGGTTLNGGVLYASASTSLTTGTLTDSSSDANVTNNNVRYAGTNVNLNVTEGANINGTLWRGAGSLDATVGNLTVGQKGAQLISDGSMSISAQSGELELGTAKVGATGNVTLDARDTISTVADVNQAIVSTTGNVTVSAGQTFTNRGKVTANTGSTTLRTNGLNNSGTIFGAAALTIADKNATATQTVANSGTIYTNAELLVKAADLTNANTGTFFSMSGINLNADSITNSGWIQATTATAVGARTLTNAGTWLLSTADSGTDALTVSGLLTNTGTIQSANASTLTAATFKNSGTFNSNKDLTIALNTNDGVTGYALENSGTLYGQTSLNLSGTDINVLNHAAGAIAGDRLGFTGLNTLTNAGRIQGGNSTATSISATHSINNLSGGVITLATTSGGSGTLTANTIDNTGTLQSIGGLGINISDKVDNNAGGKILAGGDIRVRAATSATTAKFTNNGNVESQGTLDVAGYGGTNSNISLNIGDGATSAGRDVMVKSTGIGLDDGSTLAASRNMTIRTASLLSKGSRTRIIGAKSGAGAVDVAIENNFDNNGVVASGNSLQFSASRITNTATGGFAAQGVATLNATTNFYNHGAIWSAGNLTMTAGTTLKNYGTLGAATGTIESDSNISLEAQTITNNSRISGMGNVFIKGPTFTNAPSDLTFNDPGWGWSYSDFTESGGLVRWSRERTYNGTTPFKPQIIAGGTLKIYDFVTGTATRGVLSGSNVIIEGRGTGVSTFTVADGGAVKETYTDSADDYELASMNNFDGYANYYELSLDNPARHKAPTAYSGLSGTGIFANGGNLVFVATNYTGSAAGSAQNASTTSKNIGNYASVNPQTGNVNANVVGAKSGTEFNFGGISFTLPTNPNGRFIVSPSPNANYLIETNPLYLSAPLAANTTSSDYLAKQLGYEPDKIIKRLGDAGYEAYLVQQQLIAQTGKDVLLSGTSVSAQMQQLMDSAASESKALGLVFGSAPTESQLKQLASDMVWMVESTVQGQRVLVPVVYLSEKTRASVVNGAVLEAENIAMNVGSFKNSGVAIKATQSAAIVSQSDILNKGGIISAKDLALQSKGGSISNTGGGSISASNTALLVAAKEVINNQSSVSGAGSLQIASTGNISNLSGQITGGNVTLVSEKGDITNQRVGLNANSSKAPGNGSTAAGVISASGDLAIKAGGQIVNDRSTINGTGSAVLVSGGDISNLSGQMNGGNVTLVSEKGSINNKTLSQQSGNTTLIGDTASINANKDLTMVAKDKINVLGADISAKGDALLKGEGGVNFDTIQKVTKSSSQSSKEGFLYSKETKSDVTKTEQIKSNLNTGGNLVVLSDKDIQLAGTDIKVGKDAALVAKGDVNIINRTNTVTTKTETKEEGLFVGGGLWGTSTSKTSKNENSNVATNLQVGGSLAVKADNNLTIQGSNVDVAKDASLKAKDIKILAGKDGVETHTETTTTSFLKIVGGSSSSSSSASAGGDGSANRNGVVGQGSAGAQAQGQGAGGLAFVSTENVVVDQLSQKNVASNLKVGGNAQLTADNAVTIQGSNVDVKGNTAVAAKKLELLAGKDIDTTSLNSNVTNVGLMASTNNSVDASAAASGRLNQNGGTAKVGAAASANSETGLAFVDSTQTQTNALSIKNTGSTLKSGGNLSVQASDSVTLEGSNLGAGGNLNLKTKTLDVRTSEDIALTTTSSVNTKIGLMANSTNQASAGANAEGGVGKQAAAGASVNAGSSNTLDLMRVEVSKESELSTTNKKSQITSGGNMAIDTTDLNVKGSDIAAGGNVDLKATNMTFSAAADRKESSSSKNVTTAGLYMEASTGANADANLKANAGASAEVGMGYQVRNSDQYTVAGSTTAVTSSIKAGGDLNRTAAGKITDVGTQIDVGGSMTQSASQIESLAARDTTYESSRTLDNSAKVGMYAGASAKAGVSGGVGYDASVGGRVGVDSKTEISNSESSKAVTSTINVGKNFSSQSSGKTTLEGTTIKAGGDVDVGAQALDYKAAQNTQSSSKTSVNAGAVVTVNVNAQSVVGGSVSVSADTGVDESNRTTDVAGSITAGGNTRLKSSGDMTLTGTNINSAGGTSLDAGGKVALLAAEEKSFSTSQNANATATVGMSTGGKAGAGASKETSSMVEVGVGYSQATSTSNARTAGSIRSGQATQIRSGGDLDLEGTKITSGGDTNLDAKGNTRLRAAQSTSTTVGTGVSLGAGAERKSKVSATGTTTTKETSGSGALDLSVENSTKHDKAAIQSGGKTSLSTGGNLLNEGASVNGDAGKSINVGGKTTNRTVNDSGVSVAFGAQADAKVKKTTTTPNKPPVLPPKGSNPGKVTDPAKGGGSTKVVNNVNGSNQGKSTNSGSTNSNPP